MQTIADLKRKKLSLSGLILFNDVLEDDKVQAFNSLLDALSAQELNCEKIYRQYQTFYKSMLNLNWREYLVELLLQSHNEFAVLAATGGLKALNDITLEHAARDLRIIEDFARITPETILMLVEERFNKEMANEEREIFTENLSPKKWPRWEDSFTCGCPEETDSAEKQGSAVQWLKTMKAGFYASFAAHENWADNVNLLAEYYHKVGFGLFAKYAAFNAREKSEGLEGIENNDPIRLANLICQEREQAIILRNTEGFLQGYPANNIILYGNRGTGKSSLVKALLNEYVAKGLRLVQLKKNKISLFPSLVGELAKIPLKFIIFIDDLSFNDEEEDYKNLKSLLEGGVESRPANVLVYATSNRKHLVRESFAERRVDDVHAHDTMEEKLSLADRFGITVTFLSPDQETFLKIVEGLAVQNNITMAQEELRQRALKWVMMHNGRSGRTARQFIDYLLAELAMAKS